MCHLSNCAVVSSISKTQEGGSAVSHIYHTFVTASSISETQEGGGAVLPTTPCIVINQRGATGGGMLVAMLVAPNE